MTITTFPFMDNETKIPLDPQLVRMLNDAVQLGIREAGIDGKPLGIDEMNLTTNANTISRMAEVFLNSRMQNKQKADKIINQIMSPNQMKIIITGYYHEGQDGKVEISPVIIIRNQQKFVAKNFTFPLSQVFCRNPITGEQMLCRWTARQIADAVKELLKLY
jgi:hypothetical protein